MSVFRAIRGRKQPFCSGFTLLEVLVALVIVAVALAALARAGSQALTAQASLEQRTLALWVADNVLAEIRLEGVSTAGRRQGQRRMGERDWSWQALIQPAPGDELMRVDVAVYRESNRSTPILTHTGFVPR
ncbi:type II secretion system minor pseudopilin GspI [Wenzhouxiangella limi]|uniref:Type II secretion system protein I n=1 Tax=Wenzhouxiangella limi TaxID=2707351 RepID=A0A845UX68_9GAMM|nr:type II secretion system minor pseudopilin GspI [Wenzhouxiangella limi]